MGVEIRVEGLTKRFGSQTIWDDVTSPSPAGEISVMLGPSGTGKSVFLKTLVGLLKPDAGSIWIEGKDSPGCASTTCTRCASSSGCSSRTARSSGR